MSEIQKTLSGYRTAALCGVGRTTVGYWIRSKKFYAHRIGRNYSIPVEDLLFFLQNSGQRVPAELNHEKPIGSIFKSFQNCWQHWQGSTHTRNCENCIAFKKTAACLLYGKRQRVNQMFGLSPMLLLFGNFLSENSVYSSN